MVSAALCLNSYESMAPIGVYINMICRPFERVIRGNGTKGCFRFIADVTVRATGRMVVTVMINA